MDMEGKPIVSHLHIIFHNFISLKIVYLIVYVSAKQIINFLLQDKNVNPFQRTLPVI